MDEWPILYLKVLSFDYWNRLVFESYGFVELPKKKGRYSLTINTWKPYASNPIDKLKQFFIGSSLLLENIHKNSSLISVSFVIPKCISLFFISILNFVRIHA